MTVGDVRFRRKCVPAIEIAPLGMEAIGEQRQAIAIGKS